MTTAPPPTVLDLSTQWSWTSDEDKAALQAAFGDLEPKSNAIVLVCKVHLRSRDSSPIDIAMSITVLRDLLGPYWFEEGVLVKEDTSSFFVTCSTAEGAARLALHATRRVEALRRNTPLNTFLEGLSCGIAGGEILMQEGPGGDIYGVPVEIARKLAEHVAKHGEVLVSRNALKTGEGGNNWPEVGVTSEVGSCVVSNSSVAYVLLKGTDPTPNEHAEMVASLEEEEAEDPIINLFLSLVKGEESGERVRIEQHVNKISLVTADLSGVTLVTPTKGLVQYLLLIAKQREMLKELMTKYGGEIVKINGDKVIASFHGPIPAMGCVAEAHARLDKQSRESKNDPCRIITCVGAEHGDFLNTGDDLFGWPWDVAYALSESAGGTSHDVLIGPGIFAVTKGLWEASPGTILEARPVLVKDAKLACQRLTASVAPIEASGGALTRRSVDGGYRRKSQEEALAGTKDDPLFQPIKKPSSGGFTFSFFCCSGRRG